MSLPETAEELRQLISDANAALFDILESEIAKEEAAREVLESAGETLRNLLGPADATGDTNSINGVLAFGDEVIMENSALATPLIIQGLKILTETMIQVVTVTKTKDK